MQNNFISANSDIDQKISTTGIQFTSQPDTTERRETGNVYFSYNIYREYWFV